MRFAEIILAYFLIGAVMWGAGVIAWDEAGIGTSIIDEDDAGVETEDDVEDDLEGLGGPISSAINTVTGGGLLAAWRMISGFLGFVFWPITVLIVVDAPTEIVVTAGGSLTIVFIGATIRIIRGSA